MWTDCYLTSDDTLSNTVESHYNVICHIAITVITRFEYEPHLFRENDLLANNVCKIA